MSDPSVNLLRHHRPFAWYWAGQTLSSAGSHVAAFAFPLVTAIALGGTPGDVGAVATAATLPYLLFSLLAGHLLEGRTKRKVMIPANLAQAALVGLIPITWWLDVLTVPLLAAIAFLSGSAALCFGVVGFSFVPDLVELDDLPAANRAIQGSRTVTEAAAPGGAGLLVTAVGAPAAMVATALGHLFSALGVSRARPPRGDANIDPPRSSEAKTATLWGGIRILFTNHYLRPLTLHAAVYNLASQVFTLNLVLWAVQRQDVSPGAYGLAIGATGLGALVGTAIALKLSNRLGLGPAFVTSLLLSCGVPALAAVWALTGNQLAMLIAAVMFTSGIGLGNANVYSLTLRQTVIARDQLTRSAGAYTQVMYGSIPIGSALAGLAGETLGSRWAVIAGAAGMSDAT